ncbi:MAG: GNAT family N-acetyltransferase [Chloroflexota bacterium]|nr:GNAT family N-acetyltransferase [Chloroflexota bacterium]
MSWNEDAQPNLVTERLLLRPFNRSDAVDVRELAGDRAIADTTATIAHPYPEGAAEAWISTHTAEWQTGSGMTFAVTLREGGGLVGAVGLAIDRSNDSGALGYWIGRRHWGRGFATEAAGAVVDYAFRVVGLNRVEADYMTRNPASGRVMEKLGMAHEGVFREALKKWGVFEDVARRAVLKREWETRTR